MPFTANVSGIFVVFRTEYDLTGVLGGSYHVSAEPWINFFLNLSSLDVVLTVQAALLHVVDTTHLIVIE